MGYVSNTIRAIGEYTSSLGRGIGMGIAAGTVLFALGTGDVYADPPSVPAPSAPMPNPPVAPAPPVRDPNAIKAGGKYIVRSVGFSGGYNAKALLSEGSVNVSGDMILNVEPVPDDYGTGGASPPRPVTIKLYTGAHRPEPMSTPTAAPAWPGTYPLLVKIGSTPICLNDIKNVVRRIGDQGGVIQLVNVSPVHDDNGTPADPNDDSWVINKDRGWEIDKIAVAGAIPDGFESGYGTDAEHARPGVGYRVHMAVYDTGINPWCGNPQPGYLTLFLDDVRDGKDRVHALDLLIPSGTGSQTGESAAGRLCGSAVSLNKDTDKWPNGRRSLALENVTVQVGSGWGVQPTGSQSKSIPVVTDCK